MIEIPATETLLPQTYTLANGRRLHYFPLKDTELVKLDLLFEAGSAYQPQPLVARAANHLFTAATSPLNAAQLSEFMDFRGIIIDNNSDTLRSAVSFYTLRRHLPELLPVVDDMLRRPAFPEEEFEVYRAHRRHKILSARQKSSSVARRLFYEALFGTGHPLGRHAVPGDADKLTLSEVRRFFGQHYRPGDMDIVLSGRVDDRLLQELDTRFGHDTTSPETRHLVLERPSAPETLHAEETIPGAVQATVRVGRVLDLDWNTPDYAALTVLLTALGGYFGSRLMQNLREDKGYTYGITAHSQLYRGVIVFYVTADVAAGAADSAEHEIMAELRRLIEEPLSDSELNLVRTALTGDFLRSVDGIFERSARYADMVGSDVTELFTDNLRRAVAEATPADLQRLAARHLSPETMTVCRAGAF